MWKRILKYAIANTIFFGIVVTASITQNVYLLNLSYFLIGLYAFLSLSQFVIALTYEPVFNDPDWSEFVESVDKIIIKLDRRFELFDFGFDMVAMFALAILLGPLSAGVYGFASLVLYVSRIMLLDARDKWEESEQDAFDDYIKNDYPELYKTIKDKSETLQ